MRTVRLIQRVKEVPAAHSSTRVERWALRLSLRSRAAEGKETLGCAKACGLAAHVAQAD